MAPNLHLCFFSLPFSLFPFCLEFPYNKTKTQGPSSPPLSQVIKTLMEEEDLLIAAPTVVLPPPLFPCFSSSSSSSTHYFKFSSFSLTMEEGGEGKQKKMMVVKKESGDDSDSTDEYGQQHQGMGYFFDDDDDDSSESCKKKKLVIGNSITASFAGGERRVSGGGRCCQAEKCTNDLTVAKAYHRRHRVCEYHSKAQVVLVSGLRQRFCQQCSRFHELPEFDDMKRSCRRRLAGHNERRRKNAAADSHPHNHPHEGSSAMKEDTICGQVDPRGRIKIVTAENPSYKHFQIR